MSSRQEQKLDTLEHPRTSTRQTRQPGEILETEARPLDEALRTANCFLDRQTKRENGQCDEGPLWILTEFLGELSNRQDDDEPGPLLQMDTQTLLTAMYNHNARGLSHPDYDSGRKKVKRWFGHWNDLSQGLTEAARDCGSDYIPSVAVEEAGQGKGRNRSNIYLFDTLRIEGEHKLPIPKEGEIKYTGESRENSKVGSVIINLIRSRYFVWTMFTVFVIQVVAFWWDLLNPGQHFGELLLGGVTLAFMYYVAFPLTQRQRWNIFVAPAIYQPDDGEEWLMETANLAPKGSIQLRRVKYVSKCPQCGERVIVGDGGRRFPDQLVGRCKSYPREHVFTFSSHTKLGRPLNDPCTPLP